MGTARRSRHLVGVYSLQCAAPAALENREPYDPVANKGVIGRNFTHQTISTVNGFFDNKKFNFNPFIASGSIGMCHR